MERQTSPNKSAVAILAGGKSSRMGTPKAGAVLSTGKTLFEQVYGAARDLNLPCAIVGHADGIDLQHFRDTRVIPDLLPERGPVGALMGLFRSNIAQHYLVIACDQPLLSTGLLSRLLTVLDECPNVFIEVESMNISPLPGLYPATLLAHVETLLQQPRCSLRDLLAQATVRTMQLSGEEWKQLRSANTPQDIREMNDYNQKYSQ